MVSYNVCEINIFNGDRVETFPEIDTKKKTKPKATTKKLKNLRTQNRNKKIK